MRRQSKTSQTQPVSVTLPAALLRRLDAMARAQNLSRSRLLVQLLEQALQADTQP